MKLLVINGPNLNLLGIREPEQYGDKTYKELCAFIKKEAARLHIRVSVYQSDYEGAIVRKIQSARRHFDGIVINAAAYTHTSIAILDALKAVSLPAVEVHITDTSKREPYRAFSYLSEYCEKTIKGHGFAGYAEAMRYLAEKEEKAK